MSAAPAGRSPTFVFSAAGFMATRRAGGSANLGGVVRQGADVVAVDRGGTRELAAGQLHAVAGVAGEPDGDAVELEDPGFTRPGRCLGGHAPSGSSMRW